MTVIDSLPESRQVLSCQWSCRYFSSLIRGALAKPVPSAASGWSARSLGPFTTVCRTDSSDAGNHPTRQTLTALSRNRRKPIPGASLLGHVGSLLVRVDVRPVEKFRFAGPSIEGWKCGPHTEF